MGNMGRIAVLLVCLLGLLVSCTARDFTFTVKLGAGRSMITYMKELKICCLGIVFSLCTLERSSAWGTTFSIGDILCTAAEITLRPWVL